MMWLRFFFCGNGEDARETVTVTVMRCCRESTVILGRTYFWIHTTFKFFFLNSLF